jgi:carboxylate-amine ligase
VQEDAEELGCVDEVNHTRKIAKEGTSADRQLAAFQAAIEKGVTPELAMRGVVDLMVSETSLGL